MFRDRRDAGRILAETLRERDANWRDAVVLGLPRGGVIVAREVADALGLPLDVLVVRKLGMPGHPEFAIGALGEGGVRVLEPAAQRVDPEAIDDVERRETAELERRAAAYRRGRDRIVLEGRTAIIVDDGIATGATARAACRVARTLGADRIVLAVPIAPARAASGFADDADEFVAVETPEFFSAVGQGYAVFGDTSDEEVVAALER